MKNTIFVTGGSGLVGARLLPRLVADGLECRALLRPGREAPPDVVPVQGDLLEPESYAGALEGVSAVVHLAAQFRALDPAATWQVNHLGMRALIAAVQERAPAARVVMASTAQIYDADGVHPARESDPAAPTHAYPASKLAAENDLKASGLNWSILRLCFVYGEGDGHLESVPPLFTQFQLHPASVLSLLHHRDVAQAVRLALTGALDQRVVNILDEAPTTALEMCRIVGAEMPPNHAPLANPWGGRIDGALARSLGFQPEVRTIQQAIQEGLL